MSLQEITLPSGPGAMPNDVSALIIEANRRAEKFYDAGLGLRYPKYIPSDPKVVHAAIAFLKEEGHLQGDVFCEWGCGFAIASGIASLLGMQAYGIEIEDELVDRATQLMEDLKLPVEILQTDYLPEGFDESEGVGGKDLILPESRTTRGGVIAPPEYTGLDPDEVDLFFVYPWPDQEEMMKDLFMAVATQGAVLLMYQGEGEIAAFLYDELDDDLAED
tara:strand:+ start:1449 stop:2105 length:657 start_codon:yes stop_codon:yes gene_type:complete